MGILPVLRQEVGVMFAMYVIAAVVAAYILFRTIGHSEADKANEIIGWFVATLLFIALAGGT